jgi:hypothetical protein
MVPDVMAGAGGEFDKTPVRGALGGAVRGRDGERVGGTLAEGPTPRPAICRLFARRNTMMGPNPDFLW